MRISTRLAAAAVAVCGLAAGLVACGTDDEAGSAGQGSSPADGPLVIYSGRSEDLVAPLIEDFKKESGVDVEVRYGKTSEQAQLLLTEGDNTPAHVFFSQEAGALGLLQDKDMLADVPKDLMEKVPAGFSSKEGKWVGVTGRARVVAYDKDTVDEADAPDTAAEMVDPKWKGKIAVAPGNASFLSFVTAMRVTEGEDAARDWLAKLAANEPKTYEKNGDVLEAVNTGEAELGLINHYYWYSAAAEQGADNLRAQLKYGADGDLAGLVNATGAGILTGAADREDARTFIEFLLSDAGQKYFADETYEYPLVSGIEGPKGVPPLDSMKVPDVDLSKLGTVEETAALIDEAGLTVN